MQFNFTEWKMVSIEKTKLKPLEKTSCDVKQREVIRWLCSVAPAVPWAPAAIRHSKLQDRVCTIQFIIYI